jgi:hypothetical protein
VFIEPAETQTRLLTLPQAELLDTALTAIAAAPDAAKPHTTATALRDYQHNGVRVIYYSTALGSIIIVTYIEVD